MKRIALFIGALVSDYQMNITQAIAGACEGRFRLEVFSSLGNSVDSYFHKRGEQSIIDLPDLKDFDGIIVSPDSLSNDNMYEHLRHRIQSECDCPVVSIRCKDEAFYNVTIDNRTAMNDMVEHFIVHHGFKNICFMTGRLDLEDGRERLESYREMMAKYNLPVTEHMIFEGDYWRFKGEEAVEWFLSGENRPEAIVCANDYMATSVITALQGRGLSVPKDIAVSGFDNIDEVHFFDPRLASVNVSNELMGSKAVDILEDLIAGKDVPKLNYIPVSPIFEGTCGCRAQSDAMAFKNLYRENVYLKNAILQGTYMNNDYESCITLDDLFQNAFRHSFMFKYERIFICLNSKSRLEMEENEQLSGERFTEKMRLYCMFDHESNSCRFLDMTFDRTEIIPDVFRTGNNPLYILTLHYKNNSFGYIVVETKHVDELKRFLIVWMQSLSSEMDKLELYARDKEFARFKRESTLDELTGLYNRREMENILRRRRMSNTKAGSFYVMNIDIDGLRQINEKFGRKEGDNAIVSCAQILKKLPNHLVKASRTGGDEFSLCILATDDTMAAFIKQQIVDMIEEYNQSNIKPYKLSVSIGYAPFVPSNGISSCINEADRRMYNEKSVHHASTKKK